MHTEENGKEWPITDYFLHHIGKGRHLFYDKEGNKIDMLTHSRLINDRDYSIIKQEQVGEYWISTIWLGVDTGLFGSIPLTFETMIFGKKETEGAFRYSTEQVARDQHQKIVEFLKAGVNPEDLDKGLENREDRI